MSGLWDVLIPTAGTNLLKNPSFERGLSGWPRVKNGTAEAYPSVGGLYGASYVWMDSPGIADSLYIYQGVALTAGVTYTLSIYSRSLVGAGTAISFHDNPANAAIASGGFGDASSSWQRDELTYESTSTALYYVKIALPAESGIDIDGVQLEASTAATDYIDGDQRGCIWNGPPHLSTSSRSLTTRGAGTWTDLQDLGAFVTGTNGLGLGDQEIAMSEYALRDGGEVRQTRTPSSNFSLAFTVVGSSLTDLHDKRQVLANHFRARRYGSSQPVYLRYRGTSPYVVIECWFEGGLTYSKAAADGFSERTAVRFIREAATLETETRNIQSLVTSTTIGSAAEYNFVQRVGGLWGVAGNSGVNATINDLIFTPQGLLYGAGEFSAASTSAQVVNYAFAYDGDTYFVVDSTGFSDTCFALASSPGGNVYVGGIYTTVDGGGAEMRRITKLVPSTSAGYPVTDAVAMAAGFTDGAVSDILYVSDTEVYAGGSFTSDSDATALARVAKFDGDTWSQVAAGFSDGVVYGLARGADGLTYAVGSFTTDTDGGAFPNHIASYTAGDTAWVAVGPELSDTSAKTFRRIVATPGGVLYAGGYIDGPGDGLFVKIENQTATLISDTVLPIVGMTYDEESGLVYMTHWGAGAGVSIYNGKDILPLDIVSGGTSIIKTIAVAGETIYIGGDIDEAMTAGGANTVTNNGSGNVQPILYLLAGTLKYLRNYTTGQEIYFNIACGSGEVITIDFSKGTIESSFGVNHYGDILSGDFSTFELVPGDNTIYCYVTGSGSAALAWYDQENGI